jgi:hypothetical protein
MRLEMAGPIAGSTKISPAEQARECSRNRITDLVEFSATQQAPVIMLTPVQHSYSRLC